MWWLLLLAVAILIVVLYVLFRSRLVSQTQSATNGIEPDTHEGMSIPRRRFVLLFLILFGAGLVFMEISLLSLDFPDTPGVPVPRRLQVPGTTSENQQEGETLQASSQTDGAAGAAPANSPTPVPHPVIDYVLPQSTIGSTPNMWLTVYGRNFSGKAQIRLNGRPAAMRVLSPNLLSAQLSPAELVSRGTITVDVVDGENRTSNSIIVPVTNPKVPLNVFFLDAIFPWKPWINREVQLLLVAIFAGALGSYIHLIRSATSFIGNGTMKESWFSFYIAGPFVGMAMALIFYAALRGGFLAGTAADEKVVNPFGVLALGALVGMFTDKAGMKLKDLFDTLFKSDDPRTGKLHAPMIRSLEPNRIPAGQPTEQVVTIIGERLQKVTTVMFDKTEKSVEVLSPTKITFKLDPSDLATARVLKISAVDPETGTSVSAPLSIVGPVRIIGPENLPEAKVNAPYEATIIAADGIPPLKWEISAGGAAGLSINETTGKLAGTPSATGDNDLTIKVTDAKGRSAEKPYKLAAT